MGDYCDPTWRGVLVEQHECTADIAYAGSTVGPGTRLRLAEETGLRPRSLEHVTLVAGNLLVSPGYSDERKSFYVATDLEHRHQRPQDAYIELIWKPIDGLDPLIDEVSDAGSQTTYMLLLAYWRHLRMRATNASSRSFQSSAAGAIPVRSLAKHSNRRRLSR
jgi:hypothetical protein